MSIFDRKRLVPETNYESEFEYEELEFQIQPQPDVRPPTPAPPKPADPVQASYGIQKAIELMRHLPSNNIPLIVQVVRTTLESMNIDVPSIIEDAKSKRTRTSTRIEGLRREISNLEEEIAARREEIVALEADDAETKLVQERLEMAIAPPESPPTRPPAMSRPITAPRAPTLPTVGAAAEPPATGTRPNVPKPPALG